jgi:predicted FMN-binding regulatory protein PaiB
MNQQPFPQQRTEKNTLLRSNLAPENVSNSIADIDVSFVMTQQHKIYWTSRWYLKKYRNETCIYLLEHAAYMETHL